MLTTKMEGLVPQEIPFDKVSEKIAEASIRSPDFRRELLADPKGAIQKYSNLGLKDEVMVYVHEQSDTALHFVIPGQTPEGQLTDSDLEAVAGGASGPVAAHPSWSIYGSDEGLNFW